MSGAFRRSSSSTRRTSGRTSRRARLRLGRSGRGASTSRGCAKNKDVEIARLNGVYARLLDDAGVTRIDGRARLVDAHTVAVGERRITRRAHPRRHRRLAVPAADSRASSTRSPSNEVFDLERLPERVVIVGGGYIAVEFAGIFHGLGRADDAALPRRAVPARLRRRRAARARGRDAEARHRPALRRGRRCASRRRGRGPAPRA